MAVVDAHQHFWNLERNSLPWLRPEHAAIARTFEPAELEPLLREEGIDATILVQSACHDEDTDFMFEQAARHDWIAGVVAWVDLQSPARARERLDELAAQPKLRGIRHLIHDEDDAHWILRPAVLESLALVEERGLVLELPVVFPRHLGDVPGLAGRFPGLTIVIDHLGKPPLGRDLAEWCDGLQAAGAHPNVAAKVSGLNTAIDRADWTADDLEPAIAVALDVFGASRLLCGSDWPVALLNGGYHAVWTETRTALEGLADDELEALLGGTATRLYGLASTPVDHTRPAGNSWSSSDSGSISML
jgi:L-fucono-1,5-lactonase